MSSQTRHQNSTSKHHQVTAKQTTHVTYRENAEAISAVIVRQRRQAWATTHLLDTVTNCIMSNGSTANTRCSQVDATFCVTADRGAHSTTVENQSETWTWPLESWFKTICKAVWDLLIYYQVSPVTCVTWSDKLNIISVIINVEEEDAVLMSNLS